MKFCSTHWESLKTAIKEAGLYDQVAQSGEELAQRTAAGEIDPLMYAHNCIVSNALQCGGLYLMTQKPDGSEYCPLCELEAHAHNGAEAGKEWIAGSVTDTQAALAAKAGAPTDPGTKH